VTRDELVEAFAGFPARFSVAARAAEGRQVPAGEWGPVEIARHLIAVEREVWWTRFASIVDEDEPHWAWTEPGLESDLENATLDEVLPRHAEVRARSVAILDGFDEAAWTRTGVHATYGVLDVTALLRIASDHDAEHFASLGARR
jgi:DinB superfamily